MAALQMITAVVLVQLESWSGHIELLHVNSSASGAADYVELVLWRLRRYSDSCAVGSKVAVANRSLLLLRHDAPVRFRRLPQGLYCFTLTPATPGTPEIRSPVAVLTGQAPKDRCCEHAPGQALLWSMDPDGSTLGASMSVNSSEPACRLFMARLFEGSCDRMGPGRPPLVARYQVVKNSVFYVHNLKPDRRYCLTIAAGCTHCATACSVLESKTVGAGVKSGSDDALHEPDEAGTVPAGNTEAGLDPVIAVLGVGSIFFLLAWAFHLYRRLPTGRVYKRKRRLAPV